MKPRDLFRSKFFYLGLFVLVIAVLLTTITSNYVVKNYNPPVLKDFILDNIIYIRAAWVYDVLTILAIMLTGIYIITKKPQEIPYVLLLYGITHFLRAIFILITPLGNPGLNNNPLLIGSTFVAGLYFSGHTTDTFLGFLVSKGKFKILLITLLVLIIFFLLLARGHYSIDIFSGILFAYAVFCFGEKYLKRQFTIKNK
jgi:membrane-associated phospholipid phosphatase